MRGDEHDEHPRDASRMTIIRHTSIEEESIRAVVGQVVADHDLDLHKAVALASTHPNLKEDSPFNQEIFTQPPLVKQLISCLLQPRQLMQQQHISEEEGRHYVSVVSDFLRDNYDFMELFFVETVRGSLSYGLWFDFLEGERDEDTFWTSLAYLSQIFLPLVKYEYSSSSRICDFYEDQAYSDSPVLLIEHLDAQTIRLLLRHLDIQPIFKIAYQLVLISLLEQEWRLSLQLLSDLFRACIEGGEIKDSHIENVCEMVKEISQNISNDKNNTIFAFSHALLQANLPEIAVARLERHRKETEARCSFEEANAVEHNVRIIRYLISIYTELLRQRINPKASQMLKLRQGVATILLKMPSILALLGEPQSISQAFSSGERVKSVTLARYEILNLLRCTLELLKQTKEEDRELVVGVSIGEVLNILRGIMSANRWNNICHCQIEKILFLCFTADLFESSDPQVRDFLDFLISAFNNKQYMFLGSIRMTSQGNVHALYNLCRIVTNEFERATERLKIHQSYSHWPAFVIHSLQKYQNKITPTFPLPPEYEEKKQEEGFSVAIDELASIKECVGRIEMKILWRFQGRGSYTRSGSTSSLSDHRRSGSGKSDSKPNHRKDPAMVSSMISQPDKKAGTGQPVEANMKKAFDSPGGVSGKPTFTVVPQKVTPLKKVESVHQDHPDYNSTQ